MELASTLRQKKPELEIVTRMFNGLGRCAPYEGQIGEVETSGPLDAELLSTLQNDAMNILQ